MHSALSTAGLTPHCWYWCRAFPGVGKSALVNELAPRLRAAVVSRDAARLGLARSRRRRLTEALVWTVAHRRLAGTQREAGQIVEATVAQQLESARSVIVEAVAEDALRQRLRQLAARRGARMVEVECVLTNSTEHQRRVSLRKEGERFWRSVLDMLRTGYQPPETCLRIETQAAPNELAERVLSHIGSHSTSG